MEKKETLRAKSFFDLQKRYFTLTKLLQNLLNAPGHCKFSYFGSKTYYGMCECRCWQLASGCSERRLREDLIRQCSTKETAIFSATEIELPPVLFPTRLTQAQRKLNGREVLDASFVELCDCVRYV